MRGDDEQPEPNFLDEEAKADSAPVVADLAYQARQKWKPGYCAGFIVNWSKPVARLKWPKSRADRQAFFERLKGRP